MQGEPVGRETSKNAAAFFLYGFVLVLALLLGFRFLFAIIEEIADPVLDWLWATYPVFLNYLREKVDWLAVGVRAVANLSAGASVYALVHAH